MEPISIGSGQVNQITMKEVANTLDKMCDPQKVLCSSGGGVAATLDASYYKGTGERNGKEREVLMDKGNNPTVVRRLTPLECERLQGMPDDWSRWGINEKGEVYELSDSARYKIQGNGICTPFWRWLLLRISAQYERPATLGSLFDGQASFPMLWEQINGKGSAVWSSEIEPNAVAVAKYHFPE